MRIALGIEYDGTDYVGWQRQKSGTGVQALLEKALHRVANEPVETVCAGRTDAGVHASAQVVHFDTAAQRSERSWLLGVNASLPDDVNVRWAQAVSDDFHARFSAVSRSYRYLILNRLARSGLNARRAWWIHETLDDRAMQEAADDLVGRHDFSAFRAAGCQASTPMREILALTVDRREDWLILSVTANAFLQHMVRNITGTLVEVGKGVRSPGWVRQVLANRDRKQGGMAAPPHGLELVNVTYPQEFALPQDGSSLSVMLS